MVLAPTYQCQVYGRLLVDLGFPFVPCIFFRVIYMMEEGRKHARHFTSDGSNNMMMLMRVRYVCTLPIYSIKGKDAPVIAVEQ